MKEIELDGASLSAPSQPDPCLTSLPDLAVLNDETTSLGSYCQRWQIAQAESFRRLGGNRHWPHHE